MSTPTVIGLDLSLTAPAIVVLYKKWAPGEWGSPHMRTKCWKKDLEAHKKWHAEAYGAEWWPVQRLTWIADQVAGFALATGATHIFVEGYAYDRQNAREVLAELGGVVKVILAKRAGLLTVPIVSASARKLLLGKVPSKKTSGVDVKDYVNHQLSLMGASFPTMDEGDAFVIANAGRASLGLSYVGV